MSSQGYRHGPALIVWLGGLVDGEKLIDMLERLEPGLWPVTTLEVDHGFFNDVET